MVCRTPRALVLSLALRNSLRILKLGRRDDGSLGAVSTALEWELKQDMEVQHLGFSSSGRFIMTASRDTNIKIWDIKG